MWNKAKFHSLVSKLNRKDLSSLIWSFLLLPVSLCRHPFLFLPVSLLNQSSFLLRFLGSSSLPLLPFLVLSLRPLAVFRRRLSYQQVSDASHLSFSATHTHTPPSICKCIHKAKQITATKSTRSPGFYVLSGFLWADRESGCAFSLVVDTMFCALCF